MLENILNLDRAITLGLNGSSSLYADGLMLSITYTLTWIPLALLLIYIIVKNNNPAHLFFVIAALALCIVFADQGSNICKVFVRRYRPSSDPSMLYIVDIVNGYRGGNYGFFSAHAANTMSIAVFLSLLFKQRRATWLIMSWSLLNGISRIYLGVHYFGDVIVGFIWGAIVGFLLYLLYSKISSRLPNPTPSISSEYTQGGYLTADVNLLSLGILLTYAVVVILATVIA